jgi:hypothetical protein
MHDSTDERGRAARNQELYRKVNDKIAELNAAFDLVLGIQSEWVCECADMHCTRTMELTLAEYEAVRAHPERFVVLPGHVYTDDEAVVEEHGRFVVIEMAGVRA